MEVKIIGAMPLWLAHALSELKIYKTSFSKYGRGFKDYTISKMADSGLYVNTKSSSFVYN